MFTIISDPVNKLKKIQAQLKRLKSQSLNGRIILLLFIFVTSSGFKRQFQSETEEYNLKAAFIYNFTKYVEWQKPVNEKEFVIGVLGDSPITKLLEDIARSKTVNSKKIVIHRFNDSDDLGNCHILFIPRSSSPALSSILSKVKGKGTLTVGERDGLGKAGTAMNFIILDNRIRIEANTKILDSEGLKVSSQLMKLAILV
jgi:hypothetical protein